MSDILSKKEEEKEKSYWPLFTIFSIAMVLMIQNMKEEYGLFVWPCSIVLAEYVWQQRFRFSGATVVEVMSEILFLILASHSLG